MNPQEHKWWKEAVVYQVYPRSFQDTNDDGIGDLRGVIEHLDYIKKLGATVIWLNPIYQSPNDDMGYDISDYQAIMGDFGTMADFDELLAKAHQKGLKILMDLVVNHTSDEHHWFMESKKSKDNPYRNFYHWQDGKDNHEPNNWGSFFSGSTWEKDDHTNQYYLHLFSKKQPDLNWENPEVRHAVYHMMKWWLDKGIDGFRMDVINMLSKQPGYPDGPKSPEALYGDHQSQNGPKINAYLREMHDQVLKNYDIMTVGETGNVEPHHALNYAGFDTNELNMVFQFEHMSIDGNEDPTLGKWSNRRFKLSDLKQTLSRWQTDLNGKAWNSLYWNNHDQPRIVSRFGNDTNEKDRVLSAKMLATCLHFMQGTPYIYQGEEIGMTNVKFDSLDDYRDLEVHNAYQELVVENKRVEPEVMMDYFYHISRDNARTPMQWSDAKNAGFTQGTPWIKLNPNYPTINVQDALADSNSIFYHYQKINHLRTQYPIIVYGDYHLIGAQDEEVYAYTRHLDGQRLLVICNFTGEKQERDYSNESLSDIQLLINNYTDDQGTHLRPYEAKVYLMK